MINRIEKKIALGFLLFTICFMVRIQSLHAQSSKIEKLTSQLAESESDTSKMKIMYRIAYSLRTSQPQEALQYAEDGLAMAENFGGLKYLGAFSYVKGRIEKRLGNYDVALESFNKAITYYNQQDQNKKTKKRIADVKNAIGNLHITKGEINSARTIFTESLEIAFELQDSVLIAVNYNDIGITYFNKGEYALASEYYLKAVNIREQIGHTNGLMLSYNNLGVLNKQFNKLNVAMDYYKKGLDLAIRSNDQLRIITYYNNIGSIYREKKNYGKSLEYLIQGLERAKKMEAKSNVAQLLFAIGVTYGHAKEHDNSIDYLGQSLKLYTQIDEKVGMAKASSKLGEAYVKHGEIQLGIQYLEKGKSYCDESSHYFGMQDLLDNLSIAYASLGDYQNAYIFKRQHQELNDSLVSAEAQQTVLELQQAYEDEVNTREKKQQIARLNAQKALKETQTRYLWISLMILIASLLMLGLFLYRTQRMNTKLNSQNAIIEDKNDSLRETNIQLNKAKELAEAAAKAKEEFLSTMSHEIRTPMNAVIGMTNILIDEEPRKDQVENLKTLEFSANNLLNLINDILDFSKIEAGKIEIEKVEFNLRELINNLIDTLKITSKKKGIKLLLDFDENQLQRTIVGDPTRITQIITNLVSNAIKFTETGYVKLICKVTEKNEEFADIYFAVEDTGIGIPEDRVDAIFESFTQASSNTTRKFGGTGLGLAITKRLVELQGGQIEVDSVLGEGSIFYYNLKFALGKSLSAAAKEKEIVPISRGGLTGVKVLIAEDNLINQVVAKKILLKWDVEITIANDGLEAVNCLKKESFDIILMDINMPNMDGCEATKTIRAMSDPEKSNIPIIALTASILSSANAKLFEAGMNSYVGKPFKPEELFNAMLFCMQNPGKKQTLTQ